MPIFNQTDFFTIRQLDLENKLFLPTAKLYDQVNFQLTATYEGFRFQINSLYLDICKALSETQSTLTSTALNIYEHPTETFSGWYAQATNTAVQAYERPVEALSVGMIRPQTLVQICMLKCKLLRYLLIKIGRYSLLAAKTKPSNICRHSGKIPSRSRCQNWNR